MSEYAFEGPKRASTTVTWSFATQTLASDSSFAFSSPIGAAFQSTIQAAFARWAAVSDLNFVQVADAATVAIRVGFGVFTVQNEIGQTNFRATASTISNDTVVRLLDPSVATVAQDRSGSWTYSGLGASLYQVALHEIGHALGLDHTTDPATIMYPVATGTNPDLIVGDVYGVNALYPQFTVTTLNPIAVEGNGGATTYSFSVTRYSDPSVSLAVTYAATGIASVGFAGAQAATSAAFGGSFPSGTLTFAPGATTASVSVQVPGNTAPSPDYGFQLTITGAGVVTKGSNTAVILDDDGYSAFGAGESAVYRFFDVKDGTHFFTASEAERNNAILTRGDLTYEGTGFASLASATAPNTETVFRFFDTANGTHFYTASTSERDAVLATRHDLTFEGAAFNEYAGPTANATAVLRFFDQSNGTHFYTNDPAEVAAIRSSRPDLLAEGTAFYAPST